MKRILLLFVVVFCIGIGYGAYEQRNLDTENQDEALASVHVVKAKSEVRISDVPLIMQKPELDRGCEVTSLAMLLQYAGVEVDKMELADKVKKDTTPYKYENGTYYYGNPNDGFVGDIYTFDKMGYGVYHRPVAELAEKYLLGKIRDLTGEPFEEAILKPLSAGKPVWIIINATYQKLPESEFRTWNTPSGQVQITWHEHSVVVTGFDAEFVYFNDPLGRAKKAKRKGFEEAWMQMGSQAITYK
ncbi:C39 family peptidase [Fictibacillus phosphorivorans]|uniref:C39 family peptidase n=1 Tax=Fictibacillus phosphorivorans TaxID=1221500 RepID=UPI00203DE43B|nr:C39 family peptidase [Fictibacillus phosphorivorans]MCM3718523.1 C39 family peptidase [Fictibacillus phosphorivorans]MCM3776121.1 C39 family peptidase [Fictibacillus phosphorivorans]